MIRILLAGLVLASLAVPTKAQTLPPGYVPATVVFGISGVMTHQELGGARRRDCGKSISGKVWRDGKWMDAFGRLVCK